MRCDFVSDAGALLDVATPFLAENEAENTVVLGRAVRCRRAPKSNSVLAVARDGAAVRMVAVMTPPHDLVLQLLERGWRYCLIFADRGNPITTRIYPRLGYGEIAAFATIGFRYDS